MCVCVGGGGAVYLRLSPSQLFCIKMGSDESNFNVSLIARGIVTRQCPQTTTFEEKGEPNQGIEQMLSAYQPSALPLGQIGSLPFSAYRCVLLFDTELPRQ